MSIKIKIKILLFVCAFLMTIYDTLKPIKINIDWAIVVASFIVIIASLSALYFSYEELNKERREYYAKRIEIK